MYDNEDYNLQPWQGQVRMEDQQEEYSEDRAAEAPQRAGKRRVKDKEEKSTRRRYRGR